MSVIDGKNVSINSDLTAECVLPFPLDALSAAADFPYVFFTADADLRVLFAVLPNFVILSAATRARSCLRPRGQDPLDAILFLETLEDVQEEYVAHRDRLERQVMRVVRPE
jgi:hypothetical protein